eukprot:m.165778 g.165778  ORF g.165778 m.165778 type:complete len:329 (-) comp24017_c0_seq1:852-1838(-)
MTTATVHGQQTLMVVITLLGLSLGSEMGGSDRAAHRHGVRIDPPRRIELTPAISDADTSATNILLIQVTADASLGPGAVTATPQAEMEHFVGNAARIILDRPILYEDPSIRVSWDSASLTEKASEVQLSINITLQYPSHEAAAGAKVSIETDATRAAFRAAISISVEAVFNGRDAVSIECGPVSVMFTDDIPDATHTRSRRNVIQTRESMEADAISLKDAIRGHIAENHATASHGHNHHYLRRHMGAGSAILLSGGVALMLTFAILIFIRQIRTPLSKVPQSQAPPSPARVETGEATSPGRHRLLWAWMLQQHSELNEQESTGWRPRR